MTEAQWLWEQPDKTLDQTKLFCFHAIHTPVDRLLKTTCITLFCLKAVVFRPIAMCLVVLQLIYDIFE